MNDDLIDRLIAKTKKNANGCVEWTASVKFGGYGKIGLNHKTLAAHRVSYDGPTAEQYAEKFEILWS